MAKLVPQQKTSLNETSFTEVNPDTLAPAGQFVAVCSDIRDYEDVERKVYGSDATEKTNVTRFLFRYQLPDGSSGYIETKEMKISADDRSNLMVFLTSWLGHGPDLSGTWDYAIEMVNQPALITIAHQPSRMGDRTYANILNITSLPEAMRQQVAPTPQQQPPTTTTTQGQLIEEDPFPGF
jgi:hypothetical protein